jgi:hypothetical protein
MRLINLELESAGNVRLEESTGSADCLWHRSCCELLESRFASVSAEAETIGASKIQIHSVYRVHNRPLKLRMESVVSGEDYTTEYLLWSPQSCDTRSVETVVEHGMTPFSALGEYAPVFLSYGSVALLPIHALLLLHLARMHGQIFSSTGRLHLVVTEMLLYCNSERTMPCARKSMHLMQIFKPAYV